MIDTSNWKEFRVGDLFDIHPTKAYKLTNAQLLDDGDYPVIANSAYNNGIGGYSTKEPTEKGNMVTFSDTVDANTIFYQPNDFVGYPHVQGLYPLIYEDKWNEYTYSFFVSVFKGSAISIGFDYGNKFRRDIAVDLIIKLPATSDGQPDWYYMESYMKTVMEESEKSLENLRKADDIKHLIDVSGWGEFKVGDLFDVSRPIARSSQKYEKGDMAFVASGCFNNGVTDYLEPKDENDYDEGNCLTVSPVDGYTFYQKDRFLGRGGAGSSIIILRNNMLNELRGKYLSTVIRFACKAWDYANMGNKDKLADTMISLPIDANGEPYWQYMEDYMKVVMDKSEQIISDLQIGA